MQRWRLWTEVCPYYFVLSISAVILPRLRDGSEDEYQRLASQLSFRGCPTFTLAAARFQLLGYLWRSNRMSNFERSHEHTEAAFAKAFQQCDHEGLC